MMASHGRTVKKNCFMNHLSTDQGEIIHEKIRQGKKENLYNPIMYSSGILSVDMAFICPANTAIYTKMVYQLRLL